MFSRSPRTVACTLAAAGMAGLGLFFLSGCKPSSKGGNESGPGPTPTPPPSKPVVKPTITPTPSPTPIYIPRKRMETSNLFNGMKVRTVLESEPGTTSSRERQVPSSYEVEVTVKVKVPKANQDIEELSKLNSALPELLPGLPNLLASGKVAPSYEALYGRKLAGLERNLVRLDALLSRHDFFDCETILHLQDPNTRRAALLVQGDMDVDTDGSDGDRIPNHDGKDPYFQPMTSYAWPKLSTNPNPFLAAKEEKFAALRKELAELTKTKGVGEARIQAMRDTVGAARYEVNRLRSHSFLLSATDPYIVLPGFMFSEKDPVFSPKIGDFAVVIYQDRLYPAVVGDAGPSQKVGEASLRLCKELNSRSTAYSRPVSDLKVTYLVFPNSRDNPLALPDLDRWHARVKELLDEIGGHGGTLHAWETTWKPFPTPTPTPTPTPEPTPAPAPTGAVEPGSTPAISPEPLPGSSPAASPGSAVTPTPTTLPSPTPAATSTPAAP